MSAETKKLLAKFASRANWNAVGLAADMDRFWDFVIAAYSAGEHNIPLDEFLAVVNAAARGGGESRTANLAVRKKELAAKMFMHSKYEDGIKLLRKFEGK